MRIVENSPERVVLRDRTLWVCWVCLAGAAAIAAHYAVTLTEPRQLIPAALTAAMGLFFLRASDVVFDKARKVCAVRRRDIWRVTQAEVEFRDIVDVRVEPMPVQDDEGGFKCRLSLVTAQGVLPLSAGYEPGLQRYEEMRETLLDTVMRGRPRPAAEDPVEVLVKAGHRIAAASLLRQRDGVDLATAHSRVKAMREKLGA
jgi:hypothetical protein